MDGDTLRLQFCPSAATVRSWIRRGLSRNIPRCSRGFIWASSAFLNVITPADAEKRIAQITKKDYVLESRMVFEILYPSHRRK